MEGESGEQVGGELESVTIQSVFYTTRSANTYFLIASPFLLLNDSLYDPPSTVIKHKNRLVLTSYYLLTILNVSIKSLLFLRLSRRDSPGSYRVEIFFLTTLNDCIATAVVELPRRLWGLNPSFGSTLPQTVVPVLPNWVNLTPRNHSPYILYIQLKSQNDKERGQCSKKWSMICCCLKKNISVAAFPLYDSEVGLEFFTPPTQLFFLDNSTSALQLLFCNWWQRLLNWPLFVSRGH